MIKPQKSKMMAALYGEAASDAVYNRCQALQKTNIAILGLGAIGQYIGI